MTSHGGHGRRGHGRRADIQGMRALAVTLVVLNHVTGRPRGGFIGVDVFFVISGFLITGILLRQTAERGRISITDFYVRRVKRILPMAVLVLAAIDLTAHALFVGRRVAQTVHDSVWALTFAANVRFAHLGTDYFDAHRPPSPVQHYWSLAVEEQFYVVWPTVLLVVLAVAGRRRTARSSVALVAAGATVASFAWCVLATRSDATRAYFATPARAWELGVGALLATAGEAVTRVPGPVRAVVGWAGAGVVLFSAFHIGSTTPFPGHAALWPVLGTAAMIAGGDVRGGLGARWALGLPPVVALGTISYSVYLWHWPVVTFANAYYGPGTTQAYAVAAVGTLALSIASYLLVEQPVRDARRPQRRSTSATPARSSVRRRWACAAVVGALAAPGLVASGALAAPHRSPVDVSLPRTPATPQDAPLRARQSELAASLRATTWPPLSPGLDDLDRSGAPEWQQDGCLDVNDAAGAARCTYGPPTAAHHVVVLGDSFAVSYVPAIRSALPGWDVHVLTKRECPNLLGVRTFERTPGVENTACTRHKDFALDEIARLHPDLVLMSASSELFTRLVDVDPAGPAATWRRGTGAMLAALQHRARRVVVLGSTTYSRNLQSCVTAASTPADCIGTIPDSWRAVRTAEQTAAHAHGVTYVDPSPWLCLGGQCPAVVGSTPVYWDGQHLTAVASRSLAPLLATALARVVR